MLVLVERKTMFQVNKCKQRAKEMFSDQQGGKGGRKYREAS